MSVVLLSGGTGGAKLARGIYDLIDDELAVIANTGDDIEDLTAAPTSHPIRTSSATGSPGRIDEERG